MANGQSNRDKNERELWEETCQDLFDTALLQYKSSSPMLQKQVSTEALQGDGSLLQPQHISVSSKATLLIGRSLQHKLQDQRRATNQERIGVSQVIYMNHLFVSITQGNSCFKILADNRPHTGFRQSLW